MKKLKLLALLPLLVLTSCTNANIKRVNTLIFEYTEHMEKVESVESNGCTLLLFGDSTSSSTDDGETAILTTRFDKNKRTSALGHWFIIR